MAAATPLSMKPTFPSPPSPPPGRPRSLCVAQARQIILERIEAIGDYEDIPLCQALDRILATDIVTPRDLPSYDQAAMDGYAVNGGDLRASGDTALQVVGNAYAGHPFDGDIAAGQAVRIMTGAALPAGADTVIMQETVRRDGDRLVIAGTQRRGQHVRRRGEDLRSGDIALTAGKRCGPAELGLIAALGFAAVPVYRRLRVAFFSSGDELTVPGETLQAGRIYDSNRYALLGALTRLGCEVIDLGMQRDDTDALQQTLRAVAGKVDAIVTSGGVSTGDADVVRVLLERDSEVEFWRLDMKPGRPLAFGRIGQAWLFGLPGNPVATLVAFYQIVRDALLKQAGLSPLPEPLLLSARSAATIGKAPGKREFLRGHYTLSAGALEVIPVASQGSAMLKSLSQANCFIVLPEQRGAVEAGDEVLIQPFDGLI